MERKRKEFFQLEKHDFNEKIDLGDMSIKKSQSKIKSLIYKDHAAPDPNHLSSFIARDLPDLEESGVEFTQSKSHTSHFQDLDLAEEISQLKNQNCQVSDDEADSFSDQGSSNEESPKPSRMHSGGSSSEFVSAVSDVSDSEYKASVHETPSRISRGDREDPEYVQEIHEGGPDFDDLGE